MVLHRARRESVISTRPAAGFGVVVPNPCLDDVGPCIRIDSQHELDSGMTLRVPGRPEFDTGARQQVLGLLLQPKGLMAVDEVEASWPWGCVVQLLEPGLQQAGIIH